MHENCRIPAYSQSRERFDVMWWMCTVVSLFLSFFLQGKRGRLMTVMDSKFLWTWHEKCLWSALWVPDLMCPSTSVIYLELCSHREGIGLCCNWNILSCTCLDLDICLADKLVNLRFFSVELDDQNSHYLWITPVLASQQMCLIVFAESNSVHSYFQMPRSFVKFSSNSTIWPKTNGQVRLNQYI